jgi:hypothetical protein
VDSSSTVAQPGDGAADTEQLAITMPKPGLTLADAATIEFTPGLRRPPSLGTPPPPPKPGDPRYQDRLGPVAAGSAGGRWRVLVPVVCVGLLVVAIGVGIAFWGGNPGTPAAQAAPRSLPEQIGTPAATTRRSAESSAVPSAPAEPTTASRTQPTTPPPATATVTATIAAAEPTTQPPPPPSPALAGEATVAFGTSFSFVASGFTCAGAQLRVTLGVESIPAGPVDGAGNANIVVNVSAAGQVRRLGGPPDTFVLDKGSWTLHAMIPTAAGCTPASANATITVT